MLRTEFVEQILLVDITELRGVKAHFGTQGVGGIQNLFDFFEDLFNPVTDVHARQLMPLGPIAGSELWPFLGKLTSFIQFDAEQNQPGSSSFDPYRAILFM